MTTWVPPWDPPDGAERARELFERTYGYAPAGVWSAPGRVNIIGEHVDYNGGAVLPIALPHRTYVAFSARTHSIRVVSGLEPEAWAGSLEEVRPHDDETGGVDSWAAYVAGVAWALAQEDIPVTGFDAAVESCVPYGAGLSSSAALECATALAIAETSLAHWPRWPGPDPGTESGRIALARACIRAENEIAGANTGGMDQHASLLAVAGHALHFDTGSGALFRVPFDLFAHGLELLVIDTRAPHALVDGQYAQRRATCEQAAAALGVAALNEVSDLPAALATLDDGTSRKRVRHVVTEIARVEAFTTALEQEDFGTAGTLMVRSHESLRDDYEVSCPELDLAVEAALEAGALGARMTGGGFGGSAIALVPAGTTAHTAREIQGAFTRAGFASPEFLLAPPAGPAERVV